MGNPDMAAAGTISVTVGGDEADFQAARPIFEVFTSRADYIGEARQRPPCKACVEFHWPNVCSHLFSDVSFNGEVRAGYAKIVRYHL